MREIAQYNSLPVAEDRERSRDNNSHRFKTILLRKVGFPLKKRDFPSNISAVGYCTSHERACIETILI